MELWNAYDAEKKRVEFIKELNVDFEKVKMYISYFPDKVYRNIYEAGLMSELV